jgi:hypothetical protein
MLGKKIGCTKLIMKKFVGEALTMRNPHLVLQEHLVGSSQCCHRRQLYAAMDAAISFSLA